MPGSACLRYDSVMNRHRLLVHVAFVAVIAAGASAPVWAQQGRGQERGNDRPARERVPSPEAGDRGSQRSMSESVRWAQKTTGGQVLGAERVQSDGRDFNRVKLIDDRGRVRYVDDVPQPSRMPSPPSPGSGGAKLPGF